MRFHIRHSLRYAYDRPVFLEPMTLRLMPRQDACQRVLHHALRIEAEPTGMSHILDADGHEAVVCWFDRQREALVIEAEMEVETLRQNPFDWILTHAGSQRLPVSYPCAEATSLASCFEPRGASPDPDVQAWASSLAQEVDGQTTGFLMLLAERIHADFHHIGRMDGEPMTPRETLNERTGACRDTAMLYVAACRSQGLAARFVSGYSIHHPPEVSEQELHAWAEVYLPGGGWRGYDPSLGLAVADGHVVLAAAPDHRLAAPTTGTYRGTGVGSQMDYSVRLRQLDPAPEAG